MAEQPTQHLRASPSPIAASTSSHSFTPLVAMRKSKQFQAGSSAPFSTSSLHPSIANSGILAGSDTTLPPSMFLSKAPPPPPPRPYIQQPIKATPQYFPHYPLDQAPLPPPQTDPRSYSRLAKSPDSQHSSASCLEEQVCLHLSIMKDVKRSVANIPRSSSSACPSEEIHRPQPSKSPGISSVESNRRATSFLSNQAKIAAQTRSSRGLTPPLPCGFMTSSVGKKSSGSDSEGAFYYKKEGEEAKILSSESDQERKGRADLQQGRNTKSQQSLQKPGDSIEPSNSKKPKKTRAYRAFLRKKIPRKNPVDVQSLQRVIDSMQSRTTAIYYDETDFKGNISSNKENDESSEGASSLQKLRDEEVVSKPPKTTLLRQSSLQRKKSKQSTPEMQSRTQSFIEANVSALIEDEDETNRSTQHRPPVAPSSVRYAFKQSRVLIITAKDNHEILKRKNELHQLLLHHGGPLKNIDDTYLNEGRVIAYFQDQESAQKALKYLASEAPFRDRVNVMQVRDVSISKTSSAPPLQPYAFHDVARYHHRRSDTQNSYDLRANQHDSSSHLQRLQQNRMHPGMPFQAYAQSHPHQIQLTPSTAPTDTSRDESTRFDMNNSCRITYLNTSNEHRIPEFPEHQVVHMSNTYPAPLPAPYQSANPMLMQPQQSFLSQTVSDLSANHPHHQQRASYSEYPYMYWAPYQLEHSTPPVHPQSALSSRGNSFNNSMATALGGNSWTSMGDEVLEQTWPGPFHYLNNSWAQGVPLNASAQPFLSTQGSSHSNFLPQLSPLQPSKETPQQEQKKSPGAVWGSLDLTTSTAMLNETQTEERPQKRQKKKQAAYRCSRTLFRQKEQVASRAPGARAQSAKLNDSQGNEGDIDEKQTPLQEQKEARSKEERQNVLNIAKIKRGEDLRTTLMIRNIPNKYDQKLLLKTFDPDFKNLYDFFYLPIDFKNKCNVGYAFINFINPLDIPKFYSRFQSQKWPLYNSEKICDLRYARIQGCQALQDHFKSSSVMQQPDRGVRPLFGLDRQGFRNFHGARKKKRGAPRFGKWKERDEWHSEKKGDQEFFLGDPGPPPY